MFNIHILTDQFKEQGEKLWKSLLLPDIANDKQDFVFNKLLEFYNVDEVKSLIKQSHEDELKLVQVSRVRVFEKYSFSINFIIMYFEFLSFNIILSLKATDVQ